MRLARGTVHWVLAPLLVGILLLAPLGEQPVPLLGLAAARALGALFLLVALGFLVFFRDPERAPAEGLASPADGVVTELREEPDGGTTVVVFMNLHDVHVNRAPCDGRVRSRVHEPGAHLPAWSKDSERNERMTWELDTAHGPVRVVQVAGLVARRIVPYVEAGQHVAKGERLGIIRLGSRVDLTLPPGVEPAVRVGERVRAGSSTVARAMK
jgi:phosphatidylserine decarboxylase